MWTCEKRFTDEGAITCHRGIHYFSWFLPFGFYVLMGWPSPRWISGVYDEYSKLVFINTTNHLIVVGPSLETIPCESLSLPAALSLSMLPEIKGSTRCCGAGLPGYKGQRVSVLPHGR